MSVEIPAALSAGPTVPESYDEFVPVPGLARAVRTVWIQRTGATPHVQWHLPTGGVELHVPIGGRPWFLGPLTGPLVEVLPPFSTVVGVRFTPGAALPLPVGLHELVDRRLDLGELWGSWVDRLLAAMAGTVSAEQALETLQVHLVAMLRGSTGWDVRVEAAVAALMPWRRVSIDDLAATLALSPSQLRRRCLHAVGLGPKVLQRTLRFQGFLALAQAGAAAAGSGADRVADLALEAGYADQPHLSRECLRLAGRTPSQLLGSDVKRCSCGHEHAASYIPFLAIRNRSTQPS